MSDVVANGGNLLINVGPRGEDAQIPHEQLTRLAWLEEWVPRQGTAIFGTRQWVRTGTTTAEGDEVRYSARDDTVFAFVRSPRGPVTLPDIRATATTIVADTAGAPCRWVATVGGVRVETEPRQGPIVLACHAVVAGPRS